MDNGEISYWRILRVKHTEAWSLWDWFLVCLTAGGCGIAIYAFFYSMSYKEALFLGECVVITAFIPLGIGLCRWWVDPRNGTRGLPRWEFEALKEEAFLDWCRTQQRHGSEEESDLALREVYRVNIEDLVRGLDPVELFQWCRENLEEKGFWGKIGDIAGEALEFAAEIGVLSLFSDE